MRNWLAGHAMMYYFLKAPFYQTEWNGIPLSDVAAMVGLPENNLANSDFYGAFYHEFRTRGFPLQAGWVAIKARISARVRAMIDETFLGCGMSPEGGG